MRTSLSIRLFNLNGVPVYMHWTLILLLVIIIAGSKGNPISVPGAIMFLSVLLLHEAGHSYFARKFRRDVFEIRLYPFIGLCIYEAPYNQYEISVIAAGGIIFQAIPGILAMLFYSIIGYTKNEFVDMMINIYGPLNLAIAFVNLLPITPLDGSQIWKLLPYWWRWLRKKNNW